MKYELIDRFGVYFYNLILAAMAIGGFIYTKSAWCFLILILFLVHKGEAKEKNEVKK